MNRIESARFPLAEKSCEALDDFQAHRLPQTAESLDVPLYELPSEMDELLVDSEFNPLGLGLD